jgi:3-deoxy-D-arabino-heptulosonate 7-phosphate (DAHP) synthase
VTAALDCAKRLKNLADKVSGSLYLVMRVYFLKPRTTVGWKGPVNDLMRADSLEIESGLRIGRELLKEALSIGLPTARRHWSKQIWTLTLWSIAATPTQKKTGASARCGAKRGSTDYRWQYLDHRFDAREQPRGGQSENTSRFVTATLRRLVTDGCIDWESTESLLLDIATRVAPALMARAPQ